MELLGAAMVLAAFGLLPAFLARWKGRSFLQWWIFGTLLLIPATVMVLFIRKGDARPVWGRWGLVSNPRRALPNIALFGAIQAGIALRGEGAAKLLGAFALCGVLYVVLSYFAVSKGPS